MADTQETKDRDGGSRSRRSGPRARDVLAAARDQLRELTGRDAEAATGLQPDDDGGWRVTLEVVELKRIPDTTDLLGSYEIVLDKDCEVTGWRRVRRYVRGDHGEDI